MSEAYREKWIRTSASRRMLMCLTAIARRTPTEPLRISITELEACGNSQGVVEAFEGDELVLRYAPGSTSAPRTYLLDTEKAVERSSSLWPRSDEETEIPTRLREAFGLTAPEERQAGTTLNDEQAASKEQGRTRVLDAQRRAAARRGVPLPVPQPTHPPNP